jgi:hypothetical protein
MNRWLMVLTVLAALALVACSDDPTAVIRVDRVDVDPAGQLVMVGDSVELTAVARAAGGDVVAGTVLWRSLNPDIATVRAAGAKAWVVASGVGTVRIEAESGGRTGHADIVVQAPPQMEVGSVDVLPGTLMLEVGQQVAVQAEVKSTTGQVIGGRAVAWTVEPAGAVTVTALPNGWATVTAIATGEAAIRAEVDGAAGQAWVQVAAVTPPPQQIASVVISPAGFSLPLNHETTLQAIAKLADGTIISGRPVTWTVTAPTIATITPIPSSPFASIRTTAAGSVTVRALIDGVAGETTVQVTATTPPPQQVLSLYFSMPKRGIWVNQVSDFSALLIALGVNGRIDDPALTWAVLDSTIASVDASGRVIGLRAGTTHVRAAAGSIHALIEVTVFQHYGNPAVYELTYDWWDGQWHVMPQVGSAKWTDERGIEHDVALYATAGTLVLFGNGAYERVLRIEGWAFVDGFGRRVIERDEVDLGTSTIIVGGETGYRLTSATTPGYTWDVLAAYHAGHVRMRAAIGSAPVHEYMFRLQQ